jgi:hypothetical protein
MDFIKTTYGFIVGHLRLFVILLIAILLLWAILSTRACLSRHSDADMQEKEAALAAERAEDKRLREEAIARAEAAEKREQDLRAEIVIYETAIAAAGEKVIDITEKMKVEDEQFKQDMADADIDIDYCARVRRICQRAARLFPGRKPAPECAECESAKSQ